MPRCALRPARALLGTLALPCLTLCLAACAPAASGPDATPTATPARARVPAGWKVLATTHFSLAYPPDWALPSPSRLEPPPADPTEFYLDAPDHQPRLKVDVVPHVAVSAVCPVATPDTQPAQPTTLAGLPMWYRLVIYPNGGGAGRLWGFTNAQRTSCARWAFDGDAGAATQAQDEAILATFRPANATPWQC
jgi:hypothetical protein